MLKLQVRFSMLNKIAFLILCCFFSLNAEEPPHIYLKTPNFSQENITGLNVGIRPVRKYGVRIEMESIQNKLIIHNYGYGGSGLTLSFGGSKEVLEILNNQNAISKTVAILGGGVIGLTTAYDLLEQGYDVHIYADNWSPNLTSNVAAGIWSPLWLPEGTPEEQKILNQRMLEASEQRFLMSTGEQPEFAGVRFIDSYSFKSDSLQEAIKTKHRGEDVVVYFDNGVIKKGKRISELSIDGKLFMEDLFSKVKSKGARLKERHFGNLDDVCFWQSKIESSWQLKLRVVAIKN